MATNHGRVVLLAGATGLVGREILAALLADKTVAAVHCVGRRAIGVACHAAVKLQSDRPACHQDLAGYITIRPSRITHGAAHATALH